MKINLKWRVLDLHNRKKEEKEKEHAPDYRKYTFSRKEILLYGAQGVGIAALLAWFFYHSFWAVLPLSPLILFTFKETEKTLIRRQRQRLSLIHIFPIQDWESILTGAPRFSIMAKTR